MKDSHNIQIFPILEIGAAKRRNKHEFSAKSLS